ncbi:uncharacterized protein LOC136061806 [Quercus suber]|uniref:uncharacterized protein LOC136061806 n=1 Tax=Quercus suber TaxID=58331 RepID=UPI0032DE9A87
MEGVPRQIRVELIPKLSICVMDGVSIEGVEVATITTTEPSWMDPIIEFLAKDHIPSNEKEANRVRRTAPRYWLLVERQLYRRSFGGPYRLCLHLSRVGERLVELHSGVCSSHVGGCSLAHRAMAQGFWWSQMQKYDAEYVRKYEQCQKHAPLIHLPTDYFTKWAEEEALANICDTDVKKFIWRNIVTMFGVPNSLISDNELQIDSKAFRAFCSDLNIKNKYSTPAYLQSNGQVEATNKAILNGLKKRLDSAKGRWAEELPNVLWAYRITSQKSTGETPFSLAYGAEVVIPAKLEEHQEAATIRLVEYQQKLARRYNRGVRTRKFGIGDLVLRKVVGNMRDTNSRKLAQSWEGPYRVTTIAGAGAYYLEDLDEMPLPWPWNVHNLKKFYH